MRKPLSQMASTKLSGLLRVDSCISLGCLSVVLASRASLATCPELIGSHVLSIPDDTPSISGYARTTSDTTAYRNATYV